MKRRNLPLLEPADVLAGLSGVSLAAGEPAQRAQADRVLDLLMDGLRYRAGAAGASAGPAWDVPLGP